jgi:hypothetical protein
MEPTGIYRNSMTVNNLTQASSKVMTSRCTSSPPETEQYDLPMLIWLGHTYQSLDVMADNVPTLVSCSPNSICIDIPG